MSATGVEAADARKDAKKAQRESASNVKLGPVEFRFSAGLNQEYNDNVGLSKNIKQEDFITTPSVGMEVHWPLSQLNSLDITLGLAYSKYWLHSELDTSTILVQPNSLIDFNVYIGDVRLNLHDNISVQQDPAAIPQLSNVSTFQRLNNVAGILAEWDLNTLFVNLGYDYALFKSLEDRFNFLDSSTHTVKGKVGVRASSTVTVGVQSSYSFTQYDETQTQNNGSSIMAGPFAEVIITEYLRGSASIAYQISAFDQGGSIRDRTDFNSEVYSISLQNQLNRWINHSVSFSRYTTLGIGSNFTEIKQVTYQVAADLFQNITTSLSFDHQWFEDSKSIFSEDGIRYGISPQIGYQLFEATRLNLGYQYSVKESSIASNKYEQNRVFLGVNHDF